MKTDINILYILLIEMLIQYISDIHLEFYNSLSEKLILKSEADVLCLAGDIGFPYSSRYEEFLVRMSKNFKKVFLITGNHEYYNAQGNRHHTMEEIDDRIRQIISSYNLLNVTYLDNEYEDYEGYRFVGSTLWSKCEVPIVEHCVNDFRAIKEMSVDLYNSLHDISREFLKSEVVTASPLPVIVMTHHLPSYKLIDRKYINDNKHLNKYFASESDDLLVLTMIAWIYGHTHTGSVRSGSGIKFYSNPYGYPDENSKSLYATFKVTASGSEPCLNPWTEESLD